MRLKKIFKRLLISAVVVLVVVGTAIAIALNFVFTPEKITPVIVEVLNEQLNAEVSCESVELTFFSTFPRFGAQLQNTTLVTLHTGTEKDTLASFANAAVELDVFDYLRHHNINIENINISKPKLYVYADKNGTTNWNILKESETKETTTTDSLQINDITVHNLNISEASLTHDDIATNLKHKINNFSLQLKAIKTKERIAITMHTGSDNVEAYYKEQLFHTFQSPGMDVTLDLDRTTRIVTIDSKDITVNQIHFKANGTISPNPEECAAEVDIHAMLATSDIANFVQAVPKAFLPKEHIVAKGGVFFDVDVAGLYGSGNLPRVSVNMKLKDGSIAYENIGGKIDAFSTAARADLYFDGAATSTVTIDTLLVQGTGIDFVGNLQITDVLGDANITTKIAGEVNLTTLYNEFPVNDSISLQGNAKAALEGTFAIADIQQEQYQNIAMAGDVLLENVVVAMPKDSIHFNSEKTFVKFYRETEGFNHTAVDLNLLNTHLQYKADKEMNAKEMNAHATVQEVQQQHKGRGPKHFAIQLNASMQHVKATSVSDSLNVLLQRTQLTAALHPNPGEQPSYITSNFTIDSLGATYRKLTVGVSKGGYQIKLVRLGHKKWRPEGTIGFRRLFAKVAGIENALLLPGTQLSFNDDDIQLHHTPIEFGNSAVVLNGTLQHTKGFFNGEKVSGSLALTSDYIDANELMTTFANAPEKTEAVNKTPDTLAVVSPQKKAFSIPDSLQFQFTTKIKTLHFGTTDFTQLHGDLKLEEGRLYLRDFSLITEAAQLHTQLTYTPKADATAALDFQFNLDRIEMNKLGTVFPVLDSLMPACNSFVGVADFRMKGTATLNEQLEFQSNGLEAIAALRAKDIMVLDGPTFSELAKTLKFKSKEYNPVERLEVEMQLQNNTLTILPALLEIDRYRLAFGGEQHIDMQYDYHFSVLKSPVPFKMGVNVIGEDFDHYKIKLAKAKYKYYFTNKERLQKKADPSVIASKANIRAALGFAPVVVADDNNMVEEE